MLSRVANSIYWLNRYIERAENNARFIDVNINLTMDLPPGLEEQWRPLVMTSGDGDYFREKYGEFSRKNVVEFLVFDRENANSIFSCISSARENARMVRDSLSSELWFHINEMFHKLSEMQLDKNKREENLIPFLKEVKWGSHLYSGIMEAIFDRSEAWHFAVLGRFLERADKSARILDMKYFYLLPHIKFVGTPLDLLHWSAVLKSASGFEMYRKRYGSLNVCDIVRFIVLDRAFPRSILFCLATAEHSLHAIMGTTINTFLTTAEKEIGKLRSELEYTDVDDIFETRVHEYLDNCLIKINNIGNEIQKTFFKLHEPVLL